MSDIEERPSKRIKRQYANPTILIEKKQLIHRCICGYILCIGSYSHRQSCGKFDCNFIEYFTYIDNKAEIDEYKENLEKNINCSKPENNVFQTRIDILEIQKSNYEEKSKEYDNINKELTFLNKHYK